MWMFVLGALCGIAGCLYLLASIKKKKEQDTDAVKGVSVYLNFIILDKTVAIQSGVKEKMQSKMGRGFIRDKIASGIGKIITLSIYICSLAAELVATLRGFFTCTDHCIFI